MTNKKELETVGQLIWRQMTSPFRLFWKLIFPIRWIIKWSIKHPKAAFRICLVLAVLEICWIVLINYDYASGQRSGYLRKGSWRGFIRTYESQLDQRMTGGGAYHDNDIFKFSVMSPEAIKKIELYEPQNRFVTVKYKERLFHVFWRGETTYFVTDVTVSDSK